MSAIPATAESGAAAAIGVVVIGRNEGERLKRCLHSVLHQATRIVYVDSQSTDGSAAWAAQQGIEVVALSAGQPFTAARARNAGFRRLGELAPDATLVQFVDGDCELDPAWLEAGRRFLAQRPDVGAVCGRLRERFPERSVYNMLCDMEWNAPVGASRSTGGNAMVRSMAFGEAHGYREDLIAGEEPELCVRLRAAGWIIWRLADEMALHDAAITRFGQWWRRTVRGGYAFAQGAWLHGASPERHRVTETRRAVLWGLLLPIAILALAVLDRDWLLLLLVYPLQVARLAFRDGVAAPARRRRAFFLVLGRFAEAQGALQFWASLLRAGSPALIEYK